MSARGPASIVVGAILAVLVTVAIMLSRSTAPGTDQSARSVLRDTDLRSQQAITALESALRDGDRVSFLAMWDPRGSSQEQAAEIFDNLTSLRARVALDVIASIRRGGSADDARAGWDTDVEVSWGVRGIDQADASTKLVVHWQPAGAAARVVDIEPADDTTRPIWLTGPLTVMRDADTLTASADRALAEQVERGLNQAQQDLAAAGLKWHGTLVAYVPPSQGHVEQMVGGSPGLFDNIAGITAPVETAHQPDSPQMIAINPAVFARLTAQGRRVVLTHEATHFATGAAFSTGPPWLIEGYADYVALGAARIPMSVAARRALRDVAHHGAPAALPTAAEFSERKGDRQQLAYERSWLVVRMIANHYGTKGLAEVYRDVVSDGESIEHALRTELSLTVAALTREWRDSLESLAHAA